MKTLKLVAFLILLAVPAFAALVKTGEDVVAAMHKKYDGKWYKTLTFVQKTIRYQPDGRSTTEIWYEAMSLPGNLRIDIDPADKGNGLLFAGGKLNQFKDRKLQGSQPFTHPLMVLGFDVYGQPVEKTISQLKELKVDLSVVHEDLWQGRKVYVVGARQGDLKSAQFWVDKKNLYFVRMFMPGGRGGKSTVEYQFNKYVKMKKGGWVSPEVIMNVDGKLSVLEEYSDIQANVPLDPALFDPEKWATVEKKYWLKK
jgi:outer membrane lipoprotein-sorting protein